MAYDFPTSHANRIAGMVAYCNERVGLHTDGTLLPRPTESTPTAPTKPSQ
ncbi:hypothetical protein [Streptomyces sp. NBC_00154]|nr:hypothetical protein [Streptomyces sp. NBC_00154]MCX5317912.1 hypothetical protein [Streptomyces sp. NBC_00154]